MNLNGKYWNKYYNFWDDWCANWFKAREGNETAIQVEQNNVFLKAKGGNDLYLDELPEPYLGKPSKGVDAVFLNLNPGMAHEDESSKFYSCKDKEGGLIREFIRCKCKYSDYLTEWSPLKPKLRGHDPEVCGVSWWQGNIPNIVGGRMNWVCRIYGNNNLCPSRVFALEVCPYHSNVWRLNLDDKLMKDFIVQNVFMPALTAVYENRLPYAIAVGRPIDRLLADQYVQEQLDFCCLNSWNSNNASEWPFNHENNPINRTFNLYTFNLFDRKVNILVTYAPGGNTTPANSFSQIEDEIREYANNIVAGF